MHYHMHGHKKIGHHKENLSRAASRQKYDGAKIPLSECSQDTHIAIQLKILRSRQMPSKRNLQSWLPLHVLLLWRRHSG